MVQLGFVIDQSRCIGCHACTVACKSENDVPLGDFRTWVKYTEAGEFPEVKRSFAVLRCNQCTDAPCVTICPVTALDKGINGIVDVDPKVCIGCKSCMQGCPYDALYINPDKGTAEKCHFCNHRVEQGLAPACAVVCPTEAIIPGDFDDPTSRVSVMRAEEQLERRKVEAGTGPNVMYKAAAPATLDPKLTNSSGGYIWSNTKPGEPFQAQVFEASELAELERKAKARTVYDVDHQPLWGWKITGYLLTKSLAAGIFPVGVLALLGMTEAASTWTLAALPLFALLFLALTGGLLVGDLKRPERFLYILLRPNWDSWLARGSFMIAGYGALLSLWLLFAIAKIEPGGVGGQLLLWATIVLGGLTAAYTGWLFGQAKGRVLWMKRGYWAQLLIQAGLAGSAFLLIAAPLLGFDDGASNMLRWSLLAFVAGQLAMALLEERMAPKGREEEYHRASRLITHGPYAARHWRFGVLLGMVLPMGLLLVPSSSIVFALAGALALYGLWIEEDVFVRAGQAPSIS